MEPIKAESGEEKKKPYKLNYYYHYHYCDGVQFECVLCELLPEDTDEPERLELLDAAIPTRFTARFTPVWPRCARSGSSPAVPPFHSHTSSVLHLLTALTVSRLGAAPEHPGSRPPRVRLADPPLPCPPACLPASALGVCGAPAAAYTEGAADKNSQDRKNTARIRLSGAHRTDWICRSRRVPCRDRLWFPCATLRIVINTLHCSVDAPS